MLEVFFAWLEMPNIQMNLFNLIIALALAYRIGYEVGKHQRQRNPSSSLTLSVPPIIVPAPPQMESNSQKEGNDRSVDQDQREEEAIVD